MDRELGTDSRRREPEAADDVRGRILRQLSEQMRNDAAAARDARAHARDVSALTRSQLTDLRDRELAERDAREAQRGYHSEVDRRLAAMRDEAAEQRARAASDRALAAREREAAARDRLHAAADRAISAHALAFATGGPAAGAQSRGDGAAELRAEIERARRGGGGLVVALVGVIGVQTVDEQERDPLLQRVVGEMRRHLRAYDLIARIGDQELLCAISGVGVDDAARRFDEIVLALSPATDAPPIETEFVALAPGDSADALVQRVATGTGSDCGPAA